MYIYRKNIEEVFSADNEIREVIQRGELDSFIYIVPTRRKSRYLLRELIEFAPNQTVLGLNIFTIGTFASKMFQSINFGKAEISSSLQYFLIRKIIKETELTYFHRTKEFVSNGIIEMIISVISRLKELGYDHSQFEKSIEEFTGYNKIKLEDIYEIYSEYQKYLSKLDSFETGDVYINLEKLKQEEFNNKFRKIFPSVSKIIISGFNEFTSPELNLIEKISALPNLDLTLTLDFNESNPEVFENLFETHRKITSLGFTHIELSDNSNSNFQEVIQKHLFQPSTFDEKDFANVSILSGFNVREEIEKVAKIIKYKVMENAGLDLTDICLAVKDIDAYSDLIREIFSVYGIPVNVTDRFYLKNSPVVISIISLLKLTVNNYYYKDIIKVLKSNLLKFEGIDAKNLYAVISSEKVIRGKKEILDAINYRIEILSNLSFGILNGKTSKTLKSYKKAAQDLKSLIKIIEPFEKKCTANEFKNNLINLLNLLNLHQNIFKLKITGNNLFTYEILSKESIALKNFYSLLDEMVEVYSKLEMSVVELNLNEHYEFLLSAISGTRYNLKEKAGFGVQVTTPNEIRGLKFKILFLAGLVNGVFPSRYKPLLFLEDKFIKDDRRKLLEERYLFYQSLCTFTDELYLSYPKSDEKKEFVVSDFLKALQKVVRTHSFDDSTLKNRIFTTNEFYGAIDSYPKDEIQNLSNEHRQQIESIHKIRERVSRRSENIIGDEFGGFITRTDLQKILLEKNEDKYFSITELETFAQCPYRYFLSNILNLFEEEEVEEDVTRKEKGLLLHKILQRFFSKLKKEKRNFYSELELDKNSLLGELLRIAKEEVDEIKTYNPFFFLVEEYFLGSEKVKSVFEAFIQFESESELKISPHEFEKYLRIDLKLKNDASIKLHGKIDRINFDDKSGALQVVDYKTGSRMPSKKEIEQNHSLQMPLYLKMCEKHLQDQFKKINIEDSIFLKIIMKNLSHEINSISLRKRMSLMSDLELKNFLEQKLSEVRIMIQNINCGKFNLTNVEKAKEKICINCSYSLVCRSESILS